MFTKWQKLTETQFLSVSVLTTAWKGEHVWVN